MMKYLAKVYVIERSVEIVIEAESIIDLVAELKLIDESIYHILLKRTN